MRLCAGSGWSLCKTLQTKWFKAASNITSMKDSRKKEEKDAAATTDYDNDKRFQNLLEYLGLSQYPGLISILKKLGSGTTAT